MGELYNYLRAKEMLKAVKNLREFVKPKNDMPVNNEIMDKNFVNLENWFNHYISEMEDNAE